MRYLIACLSTAFIVVSALAAEPAVVVAQPLVKFVHNARRLREFCASPGEFDACTRFVAFHLNATCARADERWSIKATATFRPWIVLYNLESLSHERFHIDDITAATERYISELGREEFSSHEACEATALAAVARFEEKMRDFAARSSALRHPSVLRLQIAQRGR